MVIYVGTQLVTLVSRICMHISIVGNNVYSQPCFVPTVYPILDKIVDNSEKLIMLYIFYACYLSTHSVCFQNSKEIRDTINYPTQANHNYLLCCPNSVHQHSYIFAGLWFTFLTKIVLCISISISK